MEKTLDHETERSKDVGKIKDSNHPRKVVVAGPGTGKSFLFTQLIKKKRKEGKTKFLAITFIGKLGDALADDLCGLADTMTMHGFARRFFLEQCPGWLYYPRMYEIIKEDLEAEGIKDFKIGDDNYKRKSVEYKAVGDADVIHYAVQICKKDDKKIPVYDLILVDEFQDFNAVESEFVDLLAQKNEIVIVGDDDQALYEFKGSSPSFIREKYDVANTEYESHTLRFCSRCTAPILRYFHNLVDHYALNNAGKERIQKEYICYLPDKEADSKANPKIHLIKNCPVGMIAYKVRDQLTELAQTQKVKEVLIIGEGRSCEALLKSVANQLKGYGFKNIDYKGEKKALNFDQNKVDAYKFISKDESSLLGWRILNNPEVADKKKHSANAKTLNLILTGTPKKLEELKDAAIENLEKEIESEEVSDKQVRKEVLFKSLRKDNVYLARPMSNFDITVCNILNSKGLGADVVFLIGFDQGRFPSKKDATDSEIYQMLVAITRAKKRIYLINTVGKAVSSFADCIDKSDLQSQEIKTGS